MFKTIRWRFILIYFMLVFIAMIIAGVFIINSYTNYYEEDVETRIDDINAVITQNLGNITDLVAESSKINNILAGFQSSGFSQEIFVLSMDNTMIASTLGELTIDPVSLLDYDLLVTGMLQTPQEGRAINRKAFTFDKIYPIVLDGEKVGNVYIRYDMTDIYRALDENRLIILQATALASIITVILGFFIARSITEPINDVTYKAAKMANGDFNQYVEVKSEDEIGKLAGMFNTLTNRLKESLSEVYQEKSKMEAIVNQMADGLIAIDLEGNVVHINQRAMQILRLREKDVPYLKYEHLITRYNIDLSLETIRESGTWTGKETVYGSESIYSLKYAPFEDDNDNKLGIVIIIQDITEEERLEKMRREFVANVSHELKTPLTSIKSYTESILDGVVDSPDDVESFLRVVNNEADRMTRLVRDLLQLGNFDSKKVKFDFEYHDYVDLVRKSTDKIKVMADKKHQQLKFECSDQEMVGYFDYDRIEQVVLNILSNAVKYTPDGGEIHVGCTKQDDHVFLRIADDGIGIPKEDLERIFERFYRVDKARSRELGGTGLGLSIAKEIVDAHEGHVTIESEVGRGTTVIIEIPLKLIEV